MQAFSFIYKKFNYMVFFNNLLTTGFSFNIKQIFMLKFDLYKYNFFTCQIRKICEITKPMVADLKKKYEWIS